MRTLAPLAIFACVILALAPAAAQAGKSDAHVGSRPAFTDRQGGDTIETAVVVTIPFSETGATGGYNDDYDETCPYTSSTSPDVVYTFTPTWSMVTDFDMYGSSYDTKLYLYDVDLNLVACNDDYYDDYTSLLEHVELAAGMQYFLVIDGYGGDFGEYVVASCEFLPCAFSCTPGSMLEGEPALYDGYVDTFNGGCDADPPVFQTLYLPQGEDDLWFCGTTGWYHTAGIRPDTDWLEFFATGDLVSVYVHAPYTIDITVEVMFIQDCENVSTLPHQLGTCSTGTIEIPTTPGEMIHLRVQPTSPTPTACSDHSDIYELNITGLDGVVAVQSTSWSAVKELYR